MSELANDENPYLPVFLPEFGVSVGWAMCRNTMCANFGVQYEGPASGEGHMVYDDRYSINTDTGRFLCRYCDHAFDLRSNRAIRVVARHFLSQSLPFASCQNAECKNFGFNAFEHHPHGRPVPWSLYRHKEGHRMLCRACTGKDSRFNLGVPLNLPLTRVAMTTVREAKKKKLREAEEDSARDSAQDPKKTTDAAISLLRSVFKGAMYYRSMSMIVEDFEVSSNVYYKQLKNGAARLRDLLAWRNAKLLQEKFSKTEAPVRVYTDTFIVPLSRRGKGPRYTHLHVPLSVVDLPKDNTYYILAAHPGFLPKEFCQNDITELQREVSGPAHTSPWDCAEHTLSMDPLLPTDKQTAKLPDVGRGGWFTRSPYTELAHLLTVRKMLSRFPKVYHYMDGDQKQSAAALTVFADDIRAGRCEIALYQRLSRPEEDAARERWPKPPKEREEQLKGKLDAQWKIRESRCDKRAVVWRQSDPTDPKTTARLFAPARIGARSTGDWDWLKFPPPGPRYPGGLTLWLTRRPDVTYEEVGRELLWTTSTLPVDRAHSHLRDDARALERTNVRAEPGRSYRNAYRDPLAVCAELWIAMFWRNFGPRNTPRLRLKDGEQPRLTPAQSMEIGRSNDPWKPDLATLAWHFRLGIRDAVRMSQWLQK